MDSWSRFHFQPWPREGLSKIYQRDFSIIKNKNKENYFNVSCLILFKKQFFCILSPPFLYIFFHGVNQVSYDYRCCNHICLESIRE